VISNVSSLKTLSYTEESSTTEFNPNFLQIIREVTNEAVINGEVAKTVETKIVDSTPVEKPLSQRDLQKKSEDFIKIYDDGSGNGIYFGSICSFVATRQIKMKSKLRNVQYIVIILQSKVIQELNLQFIFIFNHSIFRK